MKHLHTAIIVCLLFPIPVLSQSNPPPLAQIKASAENGDPKAQDQLADAYNRSMDSTNAFTWYRKAAEHGIANSQYHLGNMLIRRGYDSIFGKTNSIESIDEGVKWLMLSARQRYQAAEIDLARFYESGQFVKKDLPEAYKWYSLAHDVPGLEVVAKVSRDSLILKMTTEQINEGEKRFKTFLATKGADEMLPVPSFVDQLKLNGISGSGEHLLAIINNHTFDQGEEAAVKIDGRLVKLKCVEIRKDSALVKAEGVEKQIELKLR